MSETQAGDRLVCPECRMELELSEAMAYQDENGDMVSCFMLNQVAARCNNSRCEGYLGIFIYNRYDLKDARDFVPVYTLQGKEAEIPKATPLTAKLILQVFGRAIGRGIRAG